MSKRPFSMENLKNQCLWKSL
jgi:hypothetical protein